MVSDTPIEKSTEEEPDTIVDILQRDLGQFSDRVIDLNYGFPIAMGWASLSGLLHLHELRQFGEKLGKVEDQDRSVRYTIPIDYVTKFRSLDRRRTSSDTYFRRMPGFYIEAIIEELDAYVGNLIENILLQGGLDTKLSEKQISYSDLLKFISFEEARDHLIFKEVDRVLRSGIAEQVDWFNRAGFKIPINHPIVLRCIEIGERRNCIVHSGCEANRFYLQNCAARGVDTGKVKEGDSLRPDKKYCDGAFESILVFGIMLFSASWIKFCKKNDKEWDVLTSHLNSIVYDLMIDGLYGTAQTLLNFVFDDLKLDLLDLDRRLFKVNLALCAKELGDKKRAAKILNSEDWRATDLRFQAAVSAIKGETDETLKLLRSGFAADQIDKQALVEWPVFNHVRQLKKFKTLYAELLGSDEAEEVLAEPIKARAIGPGMKKILADVIDSVSALKKEGQVATGDEEGQRGTPKDRAPKPAKKLGKSKGNAVEK